MHQQKQRLFMIVVGTFLLVAAPFAAFLAGWQWQPYKDVPAFLFPLYLVTETGTIPQVIITCMVFAGIPLLYLKLPLKKTAIYLMIIVAYLGAGQIVKETMKNGYQEARPYVSWLAQEKFITADDFYAMPRSERAAFIAKQDFSAYNIPSWQQHHWSKETGYSFPSGHSIFAAQWLLLYLILLCGKRAYVPLIGMTVWAVSMEISRMVLGMHWGIDVFVSCLLATLLIYPTLFGFQRFKIIAS